MLRFTRIISVFNINKEVKLIGRSDNDVFLVISLIPKSFTSFLDDRSNAIAHRLNYIVDRGYRKVFHRVFYSC